MISSTSHSTCRVSPGRTGFVHSSSPPVPMMPPAIGRPPFDDQPHHGHGGMPAACHQAAEQGVACRRVVHMERLRVVVGGEPGDLAGVHRVHAADEALPHAEVVQIERVHRASIAGGRWSDYAGTWRSCHAGYCTARCHPRCGRRPRPADRRRRHRCLLPRTGGGCIKAALRRSSAPPTPRNSPRWCGFAPRPGRRSCRKAATPRWSAVPRRPRTAASSC